MSSDMGRVRQAFASAIWIVLAALWIVVPPTVASDDTDDVEPASFAFDIDYQNGIPTFRTDRADAGEIPLRTSQGTLDVGLPLLNFVVETNPDSAAAHWSRALALLRKHDYGRAVQDLDQILKSNAHDSNARLLRMCALLSERKCVLALRDMDDLLEHGDMSRAKLLAWRGAIRFGRGEYDEAVADFSATLEEDADTVPALTMRGCCYDAQGQHDKAQADFDAAIRLSPNDLHLYEVRIQNALHRHDFTQAFADCEQVFQLAPTDPGRLTMRSEIYDAQGDLQKALDDCNDALCENPRSSRAYCLRARLWQKRGHTRHALDDLQMALQVGAHDAGTIAFRSNFLGAAGKVELAEQGLDEIIREHPYEHALYTVRGILYRCQYQWQSAREDFDRAIDLFPRRSLLYEKRAEVLLEIGEIELALADIATALRLNPQSYAAREVRSRLHYKLKQYPALLDDLTELIELAPEVAANWASRGVVYAHLERWDEALPDLDKALQIDPEHVLARKNRARAWINRGDYERALQDWNVAVEKEPTNDSLWRRGVILAELGRFAEARDDVDVIIHRCLMELRARRQQTSAATAPRPPAEPDLGRLAKHKPWQGERQAEKPAASPQQTDDIPDASLAIRQWYSERAILSELLGDLPQALRDLDEARRLDFSGGSAWASRAWILATSADPEIRDCGQALRALTFGALQPAVADKLGAANLLQIRAAVHANAGDFATAVQLQTELVAMAAAGEAPEPIQSHVRQQLELYQSHQPYRETRSGIDLRSSRRELTLASTKYAEIQKQRAARITLQQVSAESETIDVSPMLRRKHQEVQITWSEVVPDHPSATAHAEPGLDNQGELDTALQTEFKDLYRQICQVVDPDGQESLDEVLTGQARTGTFVVHQSGPLQTEIRQQLKQIQESAARRAEVRLDVLMVPASELQEALDLDDVLTSLFQQATFLSEPQAQTARELSSKESGSHKAAGARFLLWNGQSAGLQAGQQAAAKSTIVVPSLKLKLSLGDQESVLVLEPADSESASPRSRRRFTLQAGESVLTDITELIPAAGRQGSTGDADSAENRVVLLISVARPKSDAAE
ncbi:MAG: tetratricopeptide repeat protein [Planctomycetes bacterium]|nr:tetratricopeptide repeat protein [Planctomycetota bacterium]